MKKIVLTVLFLISLFNNSFAKNSNANILAGSACVGAGAVVFAAYYNSREPINSVVQKVDNIWDTLCLPIEQCCSIGDVSNFLVSYQPYEYQVQSLYKIMNNRYNSLLKPWNWSAQMREAFEKIAALHQLFQLKDLIFSTYSLRDEISVIVYFQSKYFNCQYPLIVAHTYLYNAKKPLTHFLHINGVKVALAVVEDMQAIIKDSSAYVKECYLQKIEEEQKLFQARLQAERWKVQRLQQQYKNLLKKKKNEDFFKEQEAAKKGLAELEAKIKQSLDISEAELEAKAKQSLNTSEGYSCDYGDEYDSK